MTGSMVISDGNHHGTPVGVHWNNFYFWPIAQKSLILAPKWVQNGPNCRFYSVSGFFASMTLQGGLNDPGGSGQVQGTIKSTFEPTFIFRVWSKRASEGQN